MVWLVCVSMLMLRLKCEFVEVYSGVLLSNVSGIVSKLFLILVWMGEFCLVLINGAILLIGMM